MRGNCVRGCSNPHMTYYTFKVYKNQRDFSFDYNGILWSEVNMTDSYFLGIILYEHILSETTLTILFLKNSKLYDESISNIKTFVPRLSQYNILES